MFITMFITTIPCPPSCDVSFLSPYHFVSTQKPQEVTTKSRHPRQNVTMQSMDYTTCEHSRLI